MGSDVKQIARLRQRLAKAVARAPDLTEILRGTVGERYVRCGKENCRCREGKGHGPVHYLSVSLGVGRTEQVTLTPETYEIAQRYARNFARLREVLEEVSAINREILREQRLAIRRKRRDIGSE